MVEFSKTQNFSKICGTLRGQNPAGIIEDTITTVLMQMNIFIKSSYFIYVLILTHFWDEPLILCVTENLKNSTFVCFMRKRENISKIQ